MLNSRCQKQTTRSRFICPSHTIYITLFRVPTGALGSSLSNLAFAPALITTNDYPNLSGIKLLFANLLQLFQHLAYLYLMTVLPERAQN